MPRSSNHVFQCVPIFDDFEFPWQLNWRNTSNFIDHMKSMIVRGSRWDYTPPTILGGNSYLSWFYDRGAIKDPAHTGTSKGLSQAMNRGQIRKFLPKYTNVYVTIQSHGLQLVQVYEPNVTANGVRNGLAILLLKMFF